MITLTYFALVRVVAYAAALGVMVTLLLINGSTMSRVAVALLSGAATVAATLVLYHFFK